MVLVDWNNFVHIMTRKVLNMMNYYVEDYVKQPHSLDIQIAIEVVSEVIQIPILTNVRGSKDFIFCQEGKSWRRKYFSDYKNNKDDNETMRTYRERIYNIGRLSRISLEHCGCFFFQVENCEGDDLIAIISKYSDEDILIVSNDKDLRQLINNRVSIYSPSPLKRFSKANFNEQDRAELLQRLIYHGDSSDNIPSVVKNTEFSDEFTAFLKRAGKTLSPKEYLSLNDDEKQRITQNFDVFEKYIAGKNKGKDKTTKMVFKRIILTSKLKKEILQGNCSDLVKENIKRNSLLVDFDKIPVEIVNDVLMKFKELRSEKKEFNRAAIKKYKNALFKQILLQCGLVYGKF